MYIGIDFETQGFSAEKDAPTEIGLVIFNDKFEELFSFNAIIKSPLTRPQTQEIVEITGITDQMIIEQGIEEAKVANIVHEHLRTVGAMFAYNSPFDMAFLKAFFSRNGLEIPNLPVIDVMRDIPYPKRLNCRKLSHLAYDHGIIEPKENLHRAVNDVRLMIKLLSKYNLQEAIANAKEPKVKIRISPPPPWEDKSANEWVKANGFKFVSESKTWEKTVRRSEYENERNGYPYPHASLETTKAVF